jgi:hypothetical protein
MKSHAALLLLATAVSTAAVNPASGQIISGWSFDGAPYVAGATGDSVSSNVGPVAGTGYQIGFTNSIANPGTTATYTYNTVNAAGTQVDLTATVDTTVHPYNAFSTVTSQTATNDILSTSSGTITENTWRVRSANTQNANIGFSRAAPNDTQGTQWVTSTTGYSNIGFQFDLFSTNQAIRDLQLQYSTNGSTWTNVGGPLQMLPNVFQGATTPNFNVSLPANAANEPYLGVRLVAAYDSTGNTPDYAGATLTGGSTTPYNNNSGNWRLDNLEFVGTAAVPEPSTFALMGACGLLAAGRRLRRRRVTATEVAAG